MINKLYKIRLDIVNKLPTDRLNFSLSDVNSSVINIEVSNRDKVVDLTNTIVVIGVTDPSNRVGIDVVKVDQAKDGLVSYVIKPEFKNAVGKWQARLMLILGDDKVVTNTFSYEVKPDEFITINEQASIDERFPLLTDMLSRLSEIEATELDRIEAEKQRQTSIGNMRTDVDKLISDASKKINDYKLEIDNYRLAKDTHIDSDLTQYKQAKDLEIANYMQAKEAELDEYKSNKEVAINQDLANYKSVTTTDINNYKNSKDEELDNYKIEKDKSIDSYVTAKNKELDNYKLAKNTEINEFKDLKDTEINAKLEEVDTAEQSRAAAEQQRVTEHTERENFLNGFESQLGQIQTDVNDLKNNGIGNANIDDNQVRKDATWSSDKISTWSMERDGLFWTEKEGNFVSADDTYEYKLKEIEVFGDTWQDSDSKNLWNPAFSNKQYFGIIGVAGNGYYSSNISGLKPNTNYTLSIKKIIVPANGYYRIGIGNSDSSFSNSTVKWVISENNGANDNPSTVLNKFITNTTGADGILKVWVCNTKGNSENDWLFDVCEGIQLEEGTVATSYEPYHKADLSNIQHAGELYTDEQGQPILDADGKEQYKFEIEVCNKNFWRPDFENNKLNSLFIKSNTNFYFSISGGHTRFNFYDKNKKYVDYFTANLPVGDARYGRNAIIAQDIYYVEIDVGNDIRGDVYLGFDSNYNYIPHKSHKQTILLPCQLMKVGDVKDTLFWDESKGKYVVEKNIFKDDIFNTLNYQYKAGGLRDTWGYQLSYLCADNMSLKKPLFSKIITVVNNDLHGGGISKYNSTFAGLTFDNYIRFFVKNAIDKDTAEQILNDLQFSFYYALKTPQLIETNITTPITIPTYNNKTHVYVVNSNNAKATIKAKFPLKTASAVATLNVENAKNSKSILNLEEQNVDIVATSFDMDYRLLEVEWALEDAGLTVSLINTFNLNNIKGVGNMALSRYEMAKIMILGGAYEKETLTRQLTRYLEKKIITQTEYDELISLMEAKELVVGE